VIEAKDLYLYKTCFHPQALVHEKHLQNEIDRRTRVVSEVETALNEVALGRGAFLASQITLQHAVKESQFLRDKVRVQSEVVSISPTGFIARAGDPLVRKVNRAVSMIKAAGLDQNGCAKRSTL